MKLNNKRSFIRIIEALMAIIIMFLFLMYFLNNSSHNQKINDILKGNYLQTLENDDSFRNCVANENVSCGKEILNPLIPKNYGFELVITQDPNSLPENLPQDKIITTESLIISENKTHIIRLYYWKK